jgi:UDP-N-acetyl-D-mannosaminuronic acid transferase (WecB/TagA/CpsF family)
MFAEGVAKGWKFGFIGATDAVLDQGLDHLRRRFPGLKIDGRPGYSTQQTAARDRFSRRMWNGCSARHMMC